jgi:hypothetical protein
MYRGKHPKPYNQFHHHKGEWRFMWPKKPNNYNQSDYYSNYWSDSSTYQVGDGIPSVGTEQRKTVIVTHPLIRNYGLNTNGWRELIRQGRNATTSASNRKGHYAGFGSYYWYFRTVLPGTPATYRTTQWHGLAVMNPIPTASLPSFSGSLNDRAMSMFIRKARNAQTSIQGGEFIHDIGKSIASFSRLRSIFLRALEGHTSSQLSLREQLLGKDYFSPRNKKRWKSATEQISSNWLEWLYGVMPTVSDLSNIGFGLWRAYDQSQNGRDAKYVKGWAEEFSLTSSKNQIGPNSIYAHPNCRVQVDIATRLHQYIAYYGSVRLMRSGLVGNATTELGANLSNWIPTLWELIPYSFIVDYFTNVGSIIDAFCFPRSDVMWVSRTARAEAITVQNYSRVISILGTEQIQANSFDTVCDSFHSTAFVRETYNGSLVPPFRWHLPYRNTDWTGILALIGQMLGKH